MGWGQQEGTTGAEHPPGWDGEAPKGTCPPSCLGDSAARGPRGVPTVPPSRVPSCFTSPRVHGTGAGPAAGRAGGRTAQDE